MADYTEYIKTTKDFEFLKFSISYNYDTYNWATGQPKQKGYQLIATPVQKGDMWESFTAFDGFSTIILPAERKSKKRLAEAIHKFKMNREDYIKYFTQQGIITIENESKN
jgi:hypothetical protein